MKVTVAGGTGLLGQAITHAAIAAGHDVSVLSRRTPSPDPFGGNVRYVAGDVTAPETLRPALEGTGVLVDAVQFPNSPIENPARGYTFEAIDLRGTVNLADAARDAGVGQFVGLSGVGANPDARYHWLRFKWQEEQHIMGTGTPYTIFRPSWIYGPRDVSLNRFLGFARWLPFVPVVGNGKTRINPLFIDDLAAHVVAAIGNPAAERRLFEIGGPAVMTMDDVVRTALKVAGKRRFILHGPKPVMKLVASVAQYVPGRPLTPGAVDFITQDGVADTSDLVETFGLRLTPLEDGLRTYLG